MIQDPRTTEHGARKDYRIKITIRNERLLHAIELMGYKNVAEFCRFYDLNEERTRGIVNGSVPPVDKNNNLKSDVNEFLNILNLSVDEAFTKNQLKGFKRTSFTTKVNEAQLLKLTNPVKNQEQKLIERQVRHALLDTLQKYLTPREEEIIIKRYGLGTTRIHGLDELGEQFVISRERVRQIEKKAIKKLKHSDDVLKYLIKAGAEEYTD